MIGAPEIYLTLTLVVGGFLLADRRVVAWRKLVMFAFMLVMSGAMLLTSLGTPKPVALQYPRVHGTMLAYSLDEGRAIYVWVRPDDSAVPMSFRLAWSQQTAAKIEQAAQRGAAEHRAIKVSVGHGFGMGGTGTPAKGHGIPTGGDSLPGDDPAISATLAPVPPVAAKE